MGSYCLVGTVSVWDDDKVLETNSDDGLHSTIDALSAYTKLYT